MRVDRAVTRWKWPLLISFAVYYLAATAYRANRKLFWYDELATAELSRLSSWTSLWEALMRGVDFNPPLFYLLTIGAERLVGAGLLGARLPEILGFGIFCLCLFRFVSYRSSVLGGLVAMLLPLVTNAYWYSYEARPHGIVIGFCGLALVCWQNAVSEETRRRPLWLAGLGAALAAAVFNHAYGVLVFVPIVIGELTRCIIRRRIDAPMITVLVIASTAVLALVPFARLNKTPGIAGDPESTFQLSLRQALTRIYDSYVWHLGDGEVVIAAALLLFVAALAGQSLPASSDSSVQRRPRVYEIAALLGLVALPILGVCLSWLTKAGYFDRYSLSFIAGFAGLVGLMFSRFPAHALLLTVIMSIRIAAHQLDFVATTTLVEPSSRLYLHTYKPRMEKDYAMLAAFPDKNMPIGLLDNLDFAPFLYYAPPELKGRMAYLMRGRSDGLGRGYLRLQACCAVPGKVSNVEEFAAAHSSFLVYARGRSRHRLRDLLESGFEVRLVTVTSDRYVAVVSR